MKLFEYIKTENYREAKLFGITLMTRTSSFEDRVMHRTQVFAGGVIKTIKNKNLLSDSSNKEILLFNVSVFKWIQDKNYRTYYIFGITVARKSLIEEFKRKYLKYIDKKYDDIYILRANSGEIYLTLTYLIDTLIEKNKSKNPLLVATQKYHVDLINLICPEIPYIYIKNMEFKIVGYKLNIDKFRIFLLFDFCHFQKVENDIQMKPLGEVHYFDEILNRVGLTRSDIKIKPIKIPQSVENCMREKVENIGLNLDNFIFIAPEARSCVPLDNNYWANVINKINNQGFDVFVNITDKNTQFKNCEYKTCKLSLSEAFALAKRAKKIISLRCGFTEVLCQTNVPMDVLYTEFKQRRFFGGLNVKQVLSGFELTKIPLINKNLISEIDTYEYLSMSIL